MKFNYTRQGWENAPVEGEVLQASFYRSCFNVLRFTQKVM